MVNSIYFEPITTEDGQTKYKKHCHPIRSKEEYVRVCNSEENCRNWTMFQMTGDEKYKKHLVQIAYNVQGQDGQLLDEVEAASNHVFHDIDCYDRAEHDRIVGQLLAKRDELGVEEIADSAKGGIHVVLRRTPGLTILEEQVNRIAIPLKIEMDTNNADWHRVTYHGPINEETTPLLDDSLFTEELPAEEALVEYSRLEERKARGEEQVPAGAKRKDKHYRPWEDHEISFATNSEVTNDNSISNDAARQFPTEYQGIPYTIIEEWYWKVNNHGYRPTEGDRDTLTFQFASDMRHICGKNFWWLDQVIPCYDGFSLEEKRQKIRNALASKYEGFPTRLRDTLDAIKAAVPIDQSAVLPSTDSEPKSVPRGDTSTVAEIFASPMHPQMPSTLPPVLKDILKPVPKVMRATASMKVMPALGAYPKEFSVNYIDGQHREPRLNCHTVGPSGDGKDSSARGILNVINKRMKERSRQARIEIRAFNEAYNAKASNRDKPRREDFVHSAVQFIKSDITRARLNQAAQEASGATLYCEMNELSKLEELEGRFGNRCHYDIVNTADDEQNDFGQDRAGSQSVISDTCLRLNYNVNSTHEKCHKLLDHVVHEGPVGRMTFNTTPNLPIGTRLKYGKFDESYEACVSNYINNLEAATGNHECKPACRLIERLDEELADYCSLTADEMLYKQLGRRALVACFRRAIVLWAASGMKWQRSFEGWLRWSFYWDLHIKLSVFETQLRRSEQEPTTSKRGPQNLLKQLPFPVFTFQDAVRVRKLNGKDEEGTSNMIAQWCFRKYIVRLPDGSFQQLLSDEKHNNENH